MGCRKLIRSLDGSEAERPLIVRAIGRSCGKRGVRALIPRLKVRKGDPRTTSAIVAALGDAGRSEGTRPLLEAWEYLLKLRFRLASLPAHLQVLRASIIESLGAIGDQEALPVLRRGLIDEDPLVVSRAVEALARMEDEKSAPYVIRLLDSPIEGVSQSAYEALGLFGGEPALEALRKRRESDVAAVRVMASYGLARRKEEVGLILLEGFIEEVEEPYKEGILAAYYLARLGKDDGVDYLMRVAGDPKSPFRVAAIQALGKSRHGKAAEILSEIMKAKDKDLRLLAVMGLGRLGGRRAGRALESALTDPDPGVRAAGRARLAELGDYAAP